LLPGDISSWTSHIASVFLAPFGLGSSDGSVSANGTRGDVLRLTKRRLLPGLPVAVACNDQRPYPILAGAIMSPEVAVSPKFFPFEFTPLYVGMGATADYTRPTVLGAEAHWLLLQSQQCDS
jgi:hypothetical protein